MTRFSFYFHTHPLSLSVCSSSLRLLHIYHFISFIHSSSISKYTFSLPFHPHLSSVRQISLSFPHTFLFFFVPSFHSSLKVYLFYYHLSSFAFFPLITESSPSFSNPFSLYVLFLLSLPLPQSCHSFSLYVHFISFLPLPQSSSPLSLYVRFLFFLPLTPSSNPSICFPNLYSASLPSLMEMWHFVPNFQPSLLCMPKMTDIGIHS